MSQTQKTRKHKGNAAWSKLYFHIFLLVSEFYNRASLLATIDNFAKTLSITLRPNIHKTIITHNNQACGHKKKSRQKRARRLGFLLQILQPIPRQYFAQDSNKTHWFIIPKHIYTQITISSTSLNRKTGSFRKQKKIQQVSDSIIKWEDYATQASNKLKTTCSLSH